MKYWPPFAARYGNHNIWRIYPRPHRAGLLAEAVAPAGYAVTHYDGLHHGRVGQDGSYAGRVGTADRVASGRDGVSGE